MTTDDSRKENQTLALGSITSKWPVLACMAL